MYTANNNKRLTGLNFILIKISTHHAVAEILESLCYAVLSQPVVSLLFLSIIIYIYMYIYICIYASV